MGRVDCKWWKKVRSTTGNINSIFSTLRIKVQNHYCDSRLPSPMENDVRLQCDRFWVSLSCSTSIFIVGFIVAWRREGLHEVVLLPLFLVSFIFLSTTGLPLGIESHTTNIWYRYLVWYDHYDDSFGAIVLSLDGSRICGNYLCGFPYPKACMKPLSHLKECRLSLVWILVRSLGVKIKSEEDFLKLLSGRSMTTMRV